MTEEDIEMLLLEMATETVDFSNLTDTQASDLFTKLLDVVDSECKKALEPDYLYFLTLEFTGIAEHVISRLGDRKWARMIYRKSLEYLSKDMYYQIADSVINSLNDTSWAKELYEISFNNMDESGKLNSLSLSVIKTFNDKKWASVIFDEAIARLKSGDDYYIMSICAKSDFGDKDKQIEILLLGELACRTSSEYCHIVIGYNSIPNHSQKIKDLLYKAAEIACSTDDYCTIARCYHDAKLTDENVDNKKLSFHDKCISEAYNCIKSDSDRCQVIEFAALSFNDKIETHAVTIYTGDDNNMNHRLSLFEAPFGDGIKIPLLDIKDIAWGKVFVEKAEGIIPFSESDNNNYKILAKCFYEYFVDKCWVELKSFMQEEIQ